MPKKKQRSIQESQLMLKNRKRREWQEKMWRSMAASENALLVCTPLDDDGDEPRNNGKMIGSHWDQIKIEYEVERWWFYKITLQYKFNEISLRDA